MIRQKGVVALEFIILFPFIFALVYAAAVYGLVFSWQVQMQIAVDRSTAAVMHLDRSSTSNPESSALSLANQAMERFRPSFINGEDETAARCFIDPEPESSESELESSDFVKCEITKLIDGSLKIGYVPLPDKLTATASVAY